MYDYNLFKRVVILWLGLLVILKLVEGRPQSCRLVDQELGMISCCFKGTLKCDNLLPRSSFPRLKLWSSETLISAQQILSESQNFTSDMVQSLSSLPSYAMDKSRMEQLEREATLEAAASEPKTEESNCCCKEFRQVSAQTEGISETGRVFLIYQEYPERLQVRMNSICVPANCGLTPSKCTQVYAYIPQFVISDEFPDYLKVELIKTERGCGCSCHMCPNLSYEPSKLFKRLANESNNPEAKVLQTPNETLSLYNNHDESLQAKNKFIKKSLLEFQAPLSKNSSVESSVIVQKLSELVQKVLEKFQVTNIPANESKALILEKENNKTAQLSETLDDAANLLSIASDLLTYRRNAGEREGLTFTDNLKHEFQNPPRSENADSNLYSFNILKQINSNSLEENGTLTNSRSSSTTAPFNFVTKNDAHGSNVSGTNFSNLDTNTLYSLTSNNPQIQFTTNTSIESIPAHLLNGSVVTDLYSKTVSDHSTVTEGLVVPYTFAESNGTHEAGLPVADNKVIDHLNVSSLGDRNFTFGSSYQNRHSMLVSNKTDFKISETKNNYHAESYGNYSDTEKHSEVKWNEIKDIKKWENSIFRNAGSHPSKANNSAASITPTTRTISSATINSFSEFASNVAGSSLTTAREDPETTQINMHNGSSYKLDRTTTNQKLFSTRFQINKTQSKNLSLIGMTTNSQFKNSFDILPTLTTSTDTETTTENATFNTFNSSNIDVLVPLMTTTTGVPVISQRHESHSYKIDYLMNNSLGLSKKGEQNEESGYEINGTKNEEIYKFVSIAADHSSEFFQPQLQTVTNLPVQTPKPVENGLTLKFLSNDQAVAMAEKGDHSFRNSATSHPSQTHYSEIFKSMVTTAIVAPTTKPGSVNFANANTVTASGTGTILAAVTELQRTPKGFSNQLDGITSAPALGSQEGQQLDVVGNEINKTQTNIQDDSYVNNTHVYSSKIFHSLSNATDSLLTTTAETVPVLAQVVNYNHYNRTSKFNKTDQKLYNKIERNQVTKLELGVTTKKIDHFINENTVPYQVHTVSPIFTPVITNADNERNLWTPSGDPMDNLTLGTEIDRVNYDTNTSKIELLDTSTKVGIYVNGSTIPDYGMQKSSTLMSDTSFVNVLIEFASTQSVKLIQASVHNHTTPAGLSVAYTNGEALFNTQSIPDRVNADVERKTKMLPTTIHDYEVSTQNENSSMHGLSLSENSSRSSALHHVRPTTTAQTMFPNFIATNVNENKEIKVSNYSSTETLANGISTASGNQKNFGITYIPTVEPIDNFWANNQTNPLRISSYFVSNFSTEKYNVGDFNDSVLSEKTTLSSLADSYIEKSTKVNEVTTSNEEELYANSLSITNEPTSNPAATLFTKSSGVQLPFTVGALSKEKTDYSNKFELQTGASKTNKLATFPTYDILLTQTFSDNHINLITDTSITEQNYSHSSEEDNEIATRLPNKFLEENFLTERMGTIYSTINNSKTTSIMENEISLHVSSASFKNVTATSTLANENVPENYMPAIPGSDAKDSSKSLIFHKKDMDDVNIVTVKLTPFLQVSGDNEENKLSSESNSIVSNAPSEEFPSKSDFELIRKANLTSQSPLGESSIEIQDLSKSPFPESTSLTTQNFVQNSTVTMKTQQNSNIDTQSLKNIHIDQNYHKFQSLELLKSYLTTETKQRKMFWDAAEKLFDTETDYLVRNKASACPSTCADVTNEFEDPSSKTDYTQFEHKAYSNIADLILTESQIRKKSCNNGNIVLPNSVKEFLQEVEVSPLTLKLIENLFEKSSFNCRSLFNGQFIKMVAVGEVTSSFMNPLFNEIIKLFYRVYNSKELNQFKELMVWAARSHDQAVDVTDELPKIHTYEILKAVSSLRKEIKEKTLNENLTSCQNEVTNSETANLENGTFTTVSIGSSIVSNNTSFSTLDLISSNTESSAIDLISTEFSTASDIISSTAEFSIAPDLLPSTHEFSTASDIISSTAEFSTASDLLPNNHEFSTASDIISSTAEFSTASDLLSGTREYSTALDIIPSTTEYPTASDRLSSTTEYSTASDLLSSSPEYSTTSDIIPSSTEFSSLSIILLENEKYQRQTEKYESSTNSEMATTEAYLNSISASETSTILSSTNSFIPLEDTLITVTSDQSNEITQTLEIPLTNFDPENSIVRITTVGFKNEASLDPSPATFRNRTRIRANLPENFKPIDLNLEDVINHINV